MLCESAEKPSYKINSHLTKSVHNNIVAKPVPVNSSLPVILKVLEIYISTA